MLRENVPLAPLTTLGIGGPARFFAEATTEAEVVEALALADARGLPLLLLGGGSNLLVSDEGFPGLVLRVAVKGIQFCSAGGDKTLVTAGAGEDWDGFVNVCVARNLAGVECLAGIPGTVGGTPVQNVGAYGQEVSQTIERVRAWDRERQAVVELANADCGFGYRSSIFNTHARGRYVVLSVTFGLVPGGAPALRYADLQRHFAGRGGHDAPPPTLSEVAAAVRAIRAQKAMVLSPGDPDSRSAGSFFKNPVVDADGLRAIENTARERGLLAPGKNVPAYAQDGRFKVAAAWLIENAGFVKGYARGRVAISSRHTLALTNRGGATAGEVLALMREIQTGVRETFGVDLHPEPVFVGFDDPAVPRPRANDG